MIKKLLISILLLLAFTAHADDNVFRAQFTTQIKDKEPVNNLSKLENVFTSVFFFTDIRDCVSCKVEHVWYLDGKHIHTQKGTAKYPRYRWWSKKTLNDSMLGKWTVRVKINGQERVSRNLTYFAPSAVELKQAPIQKRLQLNNQAECEERLQHFNTELSNDPTNPYYKFMLNKWGTRCYGE
jgi:hypothetical protein